MAEVTIQRQTKKGKWIGDSTFLGADAEERAQAALATKRRKAFHHKFRIAPAREEKTNEQLAKDRFKHEPASTTKRWVMSD